VLAQTKPTFGRGPEAYKRHFNLYATAFPDLRFLIDSMVSEGDLVAVRWTVTGTHKGRLSEILPTGRSVGVTGITVARISGGKLHETWDQWDALGLMRQIGATQTRTQAASSSHGLEL
jgi:predicted ester cyclase